MPTTPTSSCPPKPPCLPGKRRRTVIFHWPENSGESGKTFTGLRRTNRPPKKRYKRRNPSQITLKIARTGPKRHRDIHTLAMRPSYPAISTPYRNQGKSPIPAFETAGSRNRLRSFTTAVRNRAHDPDNGLHAPRLGRLAGPMGNVLLCVPLRRTAFPSCATPLCHPDLSGNILSPLRVGPAQKNQNPARLASSGVSGAQDRTRTCTLSLALVPETSVSTNSTTWAWPVDVRHRCDRLTGCKGRQKIVPS